MRAYFFDFHFYQSSRRLRQNFYEACLSYGGHPTLHQNISKLIFLKKLACHPKLGYERRMVGDAGLEPTTLSL